MKGKTKKKISKGVKRFFLTFLLTSCTVLYLFLNSIRGAGSLNWGMEYGYELCEIRIHCG